MRTALVVILVAILTSILIWGCGPSQVQDRQQEIREKRRVNADEAVAERRREEAEREHSEAVVAAFHEWLLHATREPGDGTPTYETSITHVSFEGETLILELSATGTRGAVELCRLTLNDWPERTDLGVMEIQIVSSRDGSTLARSVPLANGSQVCE